LNDLWNTDISKYALAAVPDNNLGLDLRSGYFNAGVMLVNLNYWRAHKLNKLFYDYIHNNSEKIKLYDQDVLNSVLKDQRLLLPIKYNITCGWLWTASMPNTDKFAEEFDEAIKDPVLVHYTTTSKPWQKGCHHPYRSLFLKYKSQTMWKETPLLENRPLKLRIIKFFSGILRKYKLIPNRFQYGKEFLPDLRPLE
jgi:lipopolysaccharide biosynthesis glycosyltransferase